MISNDGADKKDSSHDGFMIHSAEDKIMLEVCWLYRKSDLPSSTAAAIHFDHLGNTGDHGYSYSSNNNNNNNSATLKEFFETDHVDDCPAYSLLFPAQLHSLSLPPGLPLMLLCCTTLLVVPTTFLFVTVIVVGGGGGSTQPQSESGVRQQVGGGDDGDPITIPPLYSCIRTILC